MKKFALSLIGLFIFFSFSYSQEITAEEILKKYFEHTGLDKYNTIKSFEIEGETQIFGDVYPFRLQYKAPNFYRWKERYKTQTVYKIINGTDTKVRNIEKIVDLGQFEQDIIRNVINYMEGFLANYKINNFKVEYDGIDKYRDTPVYILKITTPTEKTYKLYLDQRTFDIRYSTGNPFILADIGAIRFDDYTQVDGFSFPRRTQLENEQFPVITRIYSIKLNVDFPNSFFIVDSPDNKVVADQ
jgi:outer membrane lipoprotein-sorting protein